ncbi:Zinc finger mynd domain-containing protein 17 [Mycena venus]|uniref:Zinc finger mynd domain-containing protein 17 n=1 Tax=Mycena venus TaxID=2733690 RepID=A0A8H6XPJ0_9AGAR|nr:Zinc finger mynd domain-containing protein 17 [Mycena venus]
MCKALNAIEKSSSVAVATIFLPREPTTDLNYLHDIIRRHISLTLRFCERYLQREVTLFEENLVSDDPRCMVCTRTDLLIRTEAAMNGTTSDYYRRLIPCPECNLSFCCSPAHWEAARALHHAPCEETSGGMLSQCEMNREVRAQVNFDAFLAETMNLHGALIWAPVRTLSAWMSLEGLSWEGELSDEIRKSFGIPASLSTMPWIRAISDNLTMGMTILYALEKLNDGDAWTRKHTLTVHIIGAWVIEVACAIVFEEILHRLPEVNTLKLVLCGPEMPESRRAFEWDTCVECKQRGRKLIHEHVIATYHEFVQNSGSAFQPPDLCVAFNSGASQASKHTWPPTFELLVQRRIPTSFTSFDREEAEGEAALLRAAGATLHPALGPAKNPWGSMNPVPTPHQVYGFSASSGWLAGGFR